jgi:hypothetical protein
MLIEERHIARVLNAPMGSTLDDVRALLLADGLTDHDIYLVCQAAELIVPGTLADLRAWEKLK